MAAQSALVSAATYLAQELATDIRHEYVAGSVYAMSGGSRNLGEILGNLGYTLRQQLAGRPCRSLPDTIKVWVAAMEAYYYPDTSISCPPNYVDIENGIIDNPTVLIEVLSPSTRELDRGSKFAAYRTLESLKEYVLIDSQRSAVEVYSLEGEWKIRKYSSLEESAFLPSIGVRISLEEVYRHCEFETLSPWAVE